MQRVSLKLSCIFVLALVSAALLPIVQAGMTFLRPLHENSCARYALSIQGFTVSRKSGEHRKSDLARASRLTLSRTL
jgi:hypothetical protein